MFIHDTNFHTKYIMKEVNTGKQLTDLIEVHFLEIEKLLGMLEEEILSNKVTRWLKFIGSKSRSEMEMLSKRDEDIAKA